MVAENDEIGNEGARAEIVPGIITNGVGVLKGGAASPKTGTMVVDVVEGRGASPKAPSGNV